MSPIDSLHQDLHYVANAVRRRDRSPGVPAIYFLWAGLTLVGFSLPDFAPEVSGIFWLVACLGGGSLSWYLGYRDSRQHGVRDAELGLRHGLHWLVGGAAFIGVALPMMLGRVDAMASVETYMLVAAVLYALAGVHLERPMLWSGVVMFVAYAVMVIVHPPYAWTLAAIATSLSLAWAGISALRSNRDASRGTD